MLTMSPSSITVESGMPWQITSFSDVQQDLGKRLVAQRRRVGAMVADELVDDGVDGVGGDPGPDQRRHRPRMAWAAIRPATRIFSMISGVCTHGSMLGAGRSRSTYSGRGMSAGTGGVATGRRVSGPRGASAQRTALIVAGPTGPDDVPARINSRKW